MNINKQSVFLDVDPSILEKNMKIIEESPMEKEITSLLTSSCGPRSKLVRPVPGFCVKTHTKPDDKKLFVNICLLDDIPCPKDITADDLMYILHSEEPSSYRVPMSIGEGRHEYVKSGAQATVYDVAINPKFFKKVTNDNLFQTFFLTVVFEGLQDKYQIELDMQNYIILQNKKAIGTLQMHRIEIRDVNQTDSENSKNLIEEILPEESDKVQKTDSTGAKILDLVDENKNSKVKYRLRKESLPGDEIYVIAEFKIPNNVKTEELHLEVGGDRVLLMLHEDKVNFFLPYAIDQDRVVAHLNRNNEILSVKMPTVR